MIFQKIPTVVKYIAKKIIESRRVSYLEFRRLSGRNLLHVKGEAAGQQQPPDEAAHFEWDGRQKSVWHGVGRTHGRDTLHSRPGADGGGRHHRVRARASCDWCCGGACDPAEDRRATDYGLCDAPSTKHQRLTEAARRRQQPPAPHRLSLSVLCTSRSAAASPIPPLRAHFCKITRKSSSSISVSLSPMLCWFLSFPQRFWTEIRSRLCAAPVAAPVARVYGFVLPPAPLFHTCRRRQADDPENWPVTISDRLI